MKPDPIKMREAYGLPPDATDLELRDAILSDPERLSTPLGEEMTAALAALYDPQPAAERPAGPWMTLESGEVAQAALDVLALWVMARADRADFELTKMTAMDQLSKYSKHDVMRITSAVAAFAMQCLTSDRERDDVEERLQLEIMMLMESHDKS